MSDWKFEPEDVGEEAAEEDDEPGRVDRWFQGAGIATILAGVQTYALQTLADIQQSMNSDPDDFKQYTVRQAEHNGNEIHQVSVPYDKDYVEINYDKLRDTISGVDAVGLNTAGEVPWEDEVLSGVADICAEEDVPIYVTSPNNALTASSDAIASGLGTYALLSGGANMLSGEGDDRFEASRRDVLRLGLGAAAYGATTSGQAIRNLLGDPTADGHDSFDEYGVNHTDIRAYLTADAAKMVAEKEGDIANLSGTLKSRYVFEHLKGSDETPKDIIAGPYGDSLDPQVEIYSHESGAWKKTGSISR
jgi:hypothetical protein